MSLYAGTMAPLVANMLLLGIHFPTFNRVTAELKQLRGSNEINYLDTWVAGGAAGVAGSLISSPSELVRTRMTMVRKAAIVAAAKGPGAAGAAEDFAGSWDCFKKVAQRHGVVGMYKGYAPTLLRDIQVRPLPGGSWLAAALCRCHACVCVCVCVCT
jgi:solute carrier family 25 carnitine/acylcarnitine transporter 20/29